MLAERPGTRGLFSELSETFGNRQPWLPGRSAAPRWLSWFGALTGSSLGMNLAVTATVFAIVFPAELPDKTALAGLILGTRYKARLVFVGLAAAFLCHVILAVAAGSLLRLLPQRLLEAVVGGLFLLGALLLLRGRHEEEKHGEETRAQGDLSSTRVVTTSFFVILVAEFGDLTQIVTANLAAKYHDPLAVALGATLALWAVGALAAFGGQGLLKLIPIGLLVRVASVVMVILAAISIYRAVHG